MTFLLMTTRKRQPKRVAQLTPQDTTARQAINVAALCLGFLCVIVFFFTITVIMFSVRTSSETKRCALEAAYAWVTGGVRPGIGSRQA